MQETIPGIEFIEGLPRDLETKIDTKKRNLVVIDDLMNELSNDKRLSNIFTKGFHMFLSWKRVTKCFPKCSLFDHL